MNFDQGQFDFDSSGDETGYRRWREELDRRKREFESRWGVVLGAPVRLQLAHHAKPVEGIIRLIEERRKPAGGQCHPRFRIGNIEFTHGEIGSLVRLDAS